MFSVLTFSLSAVSKTCGPLIILMENRKSLPSGLTGFFVYIYLDFFLCCISVCRKSYYNRCSNNSYLQYLTGWTNCNLCLCLLKVKMSPAATLVQPVSNHSTAPGFYYNMLRTLMASASTWRVNVVVPSHLELVPLLGWVPIMPPNLLYMAFTCLKAAPSTCSGFLTLDVMVPLSGRVVFRLPLHSLAHHPAITWTPIAWST